MLAGRAGARHSPEDRMASRRMGSNGFSLFELEGKMASFSKLFTEIPGWAPVAMADPLTGSLTG
jgi:hypothetical protein